MSIYWRVYNNTHPTHMELLAAAFFNGAVHPSLAVEAHAIDCLKAPSIEPVFLTPWQAQNALCFLR